MCMHPCVSYYLSIIPPRIYATISVIKNYNITFQKNHQFIFAALFEFLMSQIFHRKKLDDFSAANMTKITTNVKKGEVGLVEQHSFVGLKYGPCREKKLKKS